MRRTLAATGQGGFTVVEILVAVTVLSIGSAVLWYSLRSTARMEKQNRLHHEAAILARSDLEGLRGRPRSLIKDTSYRVPSAGGIELLVLREVFDSARIVSTLEEVTLDENMAPLELKKPLEVRVRVFQTAPGEEDGFGGSLQGWDMASGGEEEEGSRRTLVRLLLKIPDYRWH